MTETDDPWAESGTQVPYLSFPDGSPLNSGDFSVEQYLADAIPDVRLLDSPEGRRALTELDPLLFALVYMPEAITGADGSISFADLHLEMFRNARSWVAPSLLPKENRRAYIAPRECGKSTLIFLLLPLWAAAHGHRKFVVAVADSATQARDHLQTFRQQLETNPRLIMDFPDLCVPARRQSGNVVSDSQDDFIAKSGFVFKARGIDSSILGAKVASQRPDLLILDDLEKGESTYSVEQAIKRLETMRSSILPLNLNAVVVLTGTVNMSGSIMDDLARYAQGETVAWVDEISMKPQIFPALTNDENGEPRSIWPGKWPVEWLLEEQRTNVRDFLKSFMNSPMPASAGYFDKTTFKYGKPEAVSFTMLSVDPALSTKSKSDWTGLAVISFSRSLNRFYIRKVICVKLLTEALRQRVLGLLDLYPEITTIMVESNQGADLWVEKGGAFYDLPVRSFTKNQNVSKEYRAEKAGMEFSKGRVYFEYPMPDIERQLLSFPMVRHDDGVDCITAGIIEIRARVDKAVTPMGLVVRKTSYRG